MDVYFFIVDGLESSNKADLSIGARVFVMPESMAFPARIHKFAPHLPILFDDGEGPYESIQQLKDNSEIFRQLAQTNPKRAAQIVRKPYLLPIKEGSFAAYAGTIDDEFHKHIYPLLLHTRRGTFTKNDVFGVHYFDPEYIKINQVVGFDTATGVWQAYIEVQNPYTDKWVTKREPNTFFPDKWTMSHIIAECEYAYLHRVQLSKTKFKGITKSGVLVVFIFSEQGKLKTIYPVCEEL